MLHNMPSGPRSSIRVAITGGGLAGAALAAAIVGVAETSTAKLDVHVFEAAPTFTERGAAVGIGDNGLRAMRMMPGGAGLGSLFDCLARAGAVENVGNRWLVGSGTDAGKLCFERGKENGSALNGRTEMVVHRAALLRELLANVPRGCMATNKRVAQVEERADEVVLHFTDGTSHTCDVLVGADGIHGRVRTHILGEESPVLAPVFSGFWDARALHPFERAVKALGADTIRREDSRQHDYIGDGVFFIHDIIDDGATVALAVAGRLPDRTSWPAKEWKQPLSRDELVTLFDGWPRHDAIIDLFVDQPEPTKFAEWEHLPAPTYVTRRTVIMGDAAHSMLPFQASGATQALEDALVLSRLLSSAAETSEIPAAMAAYDVVRRPRRTAVAESSAYTAVIATGGVVDLGLDADKLRHMLENRWDFIWDVDLEAMCAKAQNLLVNPATSRPT